MKRMSKAVVLVLSAGTLFQLGGCLGGWNWRQLLLQGAVYTGLEYALDGGLTDLFAEAAPGA